MATSGHTVLRTMGEVGGSGPLQLPLWPLLNPRCLLAWGSLLGRVVPTPGVSKAGLDLPAESSKSRAHRAPGAGPSGGRQVGSGLFGESGQNR